MKKDFSRSASLKVSVNRFIETFMIVFFEINNSLNAFLYEFRDIWVFKESSDFKIWNKGSSKNKFAILSIEAPACQGAKTYGYLRYCYAFVTQSGRMYRRLKCKVIFGRALRATLWNYLCDNLYIAYLMLNCYYTIM